MASPNMGSTNSPYSASMIQTRTYTSGSTYQLNSGSAITAGSTITTSITFTGLLTTDEYAVATTKAQMSALKALGVNVSAVATSAANTVSVSFYCPNDIAAASIPAAASWYCAVLEPGMIGRNLA